MAPVIAAVKVLSSVRAGSGNATRVSPAHAEQFPVDLQVRVQPKPSARRWRGGRWPGAVAPGQQEVSLSRCAKGDGTGKTARGAQSEDCPACQSAVHAAGTFQQTPNRLLKKPVLDAV